MHGQFVWYELTTPDVDGAKKFYPQLGGWGTQPFDNDYTMWTHGGAPFAGIFRLNDEMKQKGTPPNWLPYIETDNVNSSASKASSLGGKVIVQPTDIPGTGRFAVLQDPQGAMFGVYKSNGPSQGWNGEPVLGRFSWHELMTTDYQKAKEFYRKMFNWQTMSEMDMGPDNKYSMFGQGNNRMYGGMFNRMPEMGNMPPFWLMYIYVKDIKKSVDAAVKAGGKLMRGPMDIPGGGKIAILADPQGAGFALHQGAPEGAQATDGASAPAAKKSSANKVAAKKKSGARKGGAKKVATSGKSAAKKGGTKRVAAKKSSAKKSSSKKAGSKRGAKKKTGRRR